VTLVEIPSDKEIYDNIVAYWRPREPLQPGQAYDFNYTMQWTGGLRLAFKFDPGEATGAELRVQLVKDGVSLTEVWLYRWTA